jgi:hypothetical protein
MKKYIRLISSIIAVSATFIFNTSRSTKQHGPIFECQESKRDLKHISDVWLPQFLRMLPPVHGTRPGLAQVDEERARSLRPFRACTPQSSLSPKANRFFWISGNMRCVEIHIPDYKCFCGPQKKEMCWHMRFAVSGRDSCEASIPEECTYIPKDFSDWREITVRSRA